MLALKRTRTWRQGDQSPSPVPPVRVFGQPEAPRKPFRTARRPAQFGDEGLFTRGQKTWDRCHSAYGFCRSVYPIASSHSPITRLDNTRHENGEESRRPIFDLSSAEPGKRSLLDGSSESDTLLGGVIHSSSLACSPKREPSQWGWGLDLLSTPASDLRKQLANGQPASILGVGADEVTGTSSAAHIQDPAVQDAARQKTTAEQSVARQQVTDDEEAPHGCDERSEGDTIARNNASEQTEICTTCRNIENEILDCGDAEPIARI